MTRALKTSGFVGLAVMMSVGLHQTAMLAGGSAPPAWLVGGHAHLGVLSILAIVLGLAIPAVGVTGRLRTAVEGAFIVGQWGIPLTPWIAEGAGIPQFHPTAFLWGTLLIVSMLLMAWQAATGGDDPTGRANGREATPADD